MQAVLFDMDGTLVDSEPFYYERKLQFLARYHIQDKEDVLRQFMGRNMRDFFHALYDDEQAGKYYDAYRTYVQKHPADYLHMLYPETNYVLQTLKERGYLIALVSSSPWSNIHAMLEQCKLQKMFDVVISGDDFPFAKPDPAVYLAAMRQLSLLPHQCVVVEDSYSGIQAGKAAGCFVIAKTSFPSIAVPADRYISSLSEVPSIIDCLTCR